MSGFFVFNNSYAEELEVAPELPPVDSPVGELSPEIPVPPEEPNPPADGSALEEIPLPAEEQESEPAAIGSAAGSNNMFMLSNYGSGPSGNQGSGEGNGGGEVLGSETFRFTKDLWFGMKDSDVTELQKVMKGEGLLEIEGFTDFFGTLTFKAVKGYQEKYGIPVTGYVGPMTRAQLNGEEVEGAEIDKKGIQEQINNLMKKLAELMALFGKK